MPKDNEKDLDEIPDEVRAEMEIHLVESMDEVLALALDGEIRSLPGTEGGFDETSTDPSVKSGPLAH